MKSWNSFSQELTEKKAKKDYDGDGKIESGSKEHAGVVHNAIQRAKGKKADGQDTRKEEVELDENRRAARSAGGYKDDSKKQTDPSKDGFTGIGNMSIDQIRKMSARIEKDDKKKKTKKEEFQAIEEKKDPCWDTHKQVGMKKKGGRMVPNCVPKEETELQELDIKGAVTGALNKGSQFMKKNPVGRAVGNVLKPVGAGRGTARPSVRVQDRIRKNQAGMEAVEVDGEMTEGILGGAGLIAGGLAAYKAIKGMQTVNKMKNDAKSGKGLAGRLQNRTDRINKALGNSYEPEGEMVEEGKKELSREKRNKMFRRAGNLSRDAISTPISPEKRQEAHKKSGKIIKALNKDAEENNRNDVKEGYDKPDEKLKTGRKMFTIPDEERSAAAARLKEKARKKREEKCKKEELEIQEGSCGSSKKKKKTYKEEAESKAQQRLMGLALSVKRGDTPMSSVTPQVARMAREMKEKDLKDFAGTKHDGLPEKVKKEEPEVSSPLVESLVESAAQRMAAKARRETALAKKVDRQAASAQKRAELKAKK